MHRTAKELGGRLAVRCVTTEYVLLDVANTLSRSGDRAVFLSLLDDIRTDRNTTVVRSDRRLFSRGLDLYAQRMDKDWSLTDCISFVVMEQRGIRDALTADEHFKQAGFRALLL